MHCRGIIAAHGLEKHPERLVLCVREKPVPLWVKRALRDTIKRHAALCDLTLLAYRSESFAQHSIASLGGILLRDSIAHQAAL